MEITAITPKKKDPSWYHISVDGEYAFTAHFEVVEQFGLRKGLELDAAQLQQVLGEALYKKAKERALSLLSRRPYAKRELIGKLREQVPWETAEAAADRMEELGLIDDMDYAARYANDLYHLGHKSLTHIRYTLRQRGVEDWVIEKVLVPYEEEGQSEQIRLVIEKKYRSKLEADPEKARPKVIAALMRQGFPYSEVKQALEEWEPEEKW